MTQCRVCGSSSVREILSLGSVPLANAFIDPSRRDDAQRVYPLGLQWCETCAVVQLVETVDPEILFREYVYTPSASTTWRAHCAELAEWVWQAGQQRSDAFVVEPASNDGCLLGEVRKRMPDVLGIEPARNIAALANAGGIPTLAEFFGRATAHRVRSEHGPADIIVATNVLAHVPDLLDFLGGAEQLLAPHGILVIEAPYLLDLVDQVAYDTIYHEHVSYFSVTALARIYALAGLTLTSVERTPVHGGSIRFLGRPGPAEAEASVTAFIQEERERGYHDGSALEAFATRVDRLRERISDSLAQLVESGMSVAAYGATAKGNTLLTTCSVGVGTVRYIADKNPLKQGRLAPGSMIPVVSPDRIDADPPDVLLILAWNLRDEVMREQREYHRRGGRFLIPIPEPTLS